MIIETAVAFIFIFAILVMFHELGHYIAARLTGMRVEEFAFGFGPRILTLFKRGDTEYTVHAFPLGGFVKIAGMEPGQEDIKDGFQAQSIPKRAITIFAGPFASFLLAMLVFLGLGLFWGYPVGRTTNQVAMVSPQTEAARAGLRAGDKVLEIDGTKITDGVQMTDIIHNKAGESINLVAQRGSETMHIVAHPKWRIDYLGAIWSFMKDNQGVLANAYKGYPADKAGFQIGDKLISINGKAIHDGADMVAAIKAANSKDVRIDVERGKKRFSVKIKPVVSLIRFQNIELHFPDAMVLKADPLSHLITQDQLIKVNGKDVFSGDRAMSGGEFVDTLKKAKGSKVLLTVMRDGEEKNISLNVTPSDLVNLKTQDYYAYGILGFTPETAKIKTGVVESLSRGLKITGNMVQQLIATLTTSRIKEDIGGPIMIVKITQSSVARGPYEVLTLLGGLSLSLAFINLIPIPIVDGGHLVILAVEAVRRKRLTAEQMGYLTMIGLAILAVLMILVFSSDISKLLNHQVPQ